MSEKAVDWAFEQDVENFKQKALLVCIAFFFDDESGKSQVSLEFLKGRLCRTERTIKGGIKDLVRLGLVSQVEGEEYCFTIPALKETQPVSFKAMEWAMRQRPASPSEKMVLVFLAYCLNDKTKQCSPSIATIADETRQSKRTVQSVLSKLEVAGLISRRLIFDAQSRACIGCQYRLPAFEKLFLRGDL